MNGFPSIDVCSYLHCGTSANLRLSPFQLLFHPPSHTRTNTLAPQGKIDYVSVVWAGLFTLALWIMFPCFCQKGVCRCVCERDREGWNTVWGLGFGRKLRGAHRLALWSKMPVGQAWDGWSTEDVFFNADGCNSCLHPQGMIKKVQ